MAEMVSKDRLPGLPIGLWPLHPHPRENELLSSWIIRLAHIHGYKVETFCSIIFGRQSSLWSRDIDKLAPEFVIKGLVRATGRPADEVYRTTLAGYSDFLSEKVNVSGDSRWLIPLGVYHRRRTKPGLMYCPRCLGEENGGYYRRLWRVGWVTVCTRHGCFLRDTCPYCHAPVMPHRADMTSRSTIPNPRTIITCFQCESDLSSGHTIAAPQFIVGTQAIFEQTLMAGYRAWANNWSLRSFLFFDGLRALSAGVVRLERSYRRRQGLPRAPVMAVEHMTLFQRREHIWDLMLLLEDWPRCFLEFMRCQHIRYTELHVFEGGIPYWYESVLRQVVEIHVSSRGEQ